MQRIVTKFRRVAPLFLAALLTEDALAQSCPPGPVLCPPGSLLLYPEFDDRAYSPEGEGGFTDQDGRDYLVTVTNTSVTSGVDVEFVYIDGSNCLEFNRTEHLTANDTLSVITKYHNPKGTRGYLYVFAKDPSGEPISFNHLIGNELVYGPEGFGELDYGHKAFVFPAAAGLPPGTQTDIDQDGVRDLDGFEYQRAPDEILIPRFLGQAPQGTPESELILIALSGGAAFTTTVNILIWNDNEEPFSSQTAFACWTKRPLLSVTPAFSNNFLHDATNDAVNEILGWDSQEAGWMRLNGEVAISSAELIVDPAILAVLIERQGYQAVSDLPFGFGSQSNGALIPHGVFGDGDPIPVSGDNQ